MKFVDHEQEPSESLLSLIWFHCESHWWFFTCQNDL